MQDEMEAGSANGGLFVRGAHRQIVLQVRDNGRMNLFPQQPKLEEEATA